jgi:predicted HAD superfamily phosphohydrolase YqeG
MENKQKQFILAFDWGDTLMRILPGMEGPMVNWPQVEMVPGVGDALADLQGNYRLVVATNASDSTAPEVRKALARVGLAEYFETIITYHELKARKPELAFFRNVQTMLGVTSSECWMIGDSYAVDVLGSRLADWHSLWFNPGCHPAPGLMPLYDQEVQEMSALRSVLEKPSLPHIETCLAWLQSAGCTGVLLAHVQAVAGAAYKMAVWLKAKGVEVDPLLTHRGGMLHDLARISKSLFDPFNLDHGELAARLLVDKKQPILAEIARRHLLFCLQDPARRPETWEQKLVYYADKIVEDHKLVGLEERLASLQRRHNLEEERLTKIIPVLRTLENEICGKLEINPDELLPNLGNAFVNANHS